jgi:enoyl-CoA hydratase/carnithine racemase
MRTRPGGDVLGENEALGLKRHSHLLDNILRCEQPIICAINGDCIGLAATIALMCDITVASESARIADTHVSRVGLVAGDGGAVLWPMLVGPHRAKEFLLRGTILNGAEAARIGLINHAVPPENTLSEALKIARELADGPTWAIREQMGQASSEPDLRHVSCHGAHQLPHGGPQGGNPCVHRKAQPEVHREMRV